MNLKSLLVVLAAVVAGTLGGAVAYQVAVPAGNAQPAATESIVLKSPDRAEQRERRKVKFAPCRRPARLEGNRCVTDVVRTVAVQPQQTAAPVAPAAPAPSRSSGSSFNDDSRHGGGDDDSGHAVVDDDDNSGPGGGGDDDSHTGTHTNTGTNTGTRTRSHD